MPGTHKKRQVARSPEALAAKKDLILDAALALVADEGYARSTISRIAQKAGIGRGTVYWHFESKDELFLGLMQRELDRIVEGMPAVLEMDLPPVEKFESLVAGFFQFYEQFGQAPNVLKAYLAVFTGVGDATRDRMAAVAAEAYGQFNGLLTDLLEDGKSRGQVRPELDSPIAAAAVVVLLDAMYLQVAFGLVENDPARLATSILDLLGRGYRSPEGDPR